MTRALIGFLLFGAMTCFLVSCGPGSAVNPGGDPAFSLVKVAGPVEGEVIDESVVRFSWQLQNSEARQVKTTVDYYYRLDQTGEWTSTKSAQTFDWNLDKTGDHVFELYGRRGSALSNNTLRWQFSYSGGANQLPLVLFVTTPESVMNPNAFTFSWVGQSKVSAIASYEIRLNEGEWLRNELNATYQWVNIPIQDNVFSVRATDLEGRVSPVAQCKFTRSP
ncbi:MAG: hypothetical protein KBC39_09455 [Thermotogae bacterium]|nr:hypothetical protein [Thermotogota bacterium]